jgi:hypothetical protein
VGFFECVFCLVFCRLSKFLASFVWKGLQYVNFRPLLAFVRVACKTYSCNVKNLPPECNRWGGLAVMDLIVLAQDLDEFRLWTKLLVGGGLCPAD